MPSRGSDTPWQEHAPTVSVIVKLSRPTLVVELGTYDGASYAGLCEAAAQLHSPPRCVSIGCWRSASQGDPWGRETLLDVRLRHDARYSAFSRILEVERDLEEAGRSIGEGTVDLLHLTERVAIGSVDFRLRDWLPRLSRRGVILLSGTARTEWQSQPLRAQWRELEARHPALELWHGQGLSAIAVGDEMADPVRDFFGSARTSEGRHLLGLLRAVGQLARENGRQATCLGRLRSLEAGLAPAPPAPPCRHEALEARIRHAAEQIDEANAKARQAILQRDEANVNFRLAAAQRDEAAAEARLLARELKEVRSTLARPPEILARLAFLSGRVRALARAAFRQLQALPRLLLPRVEA